MCQGHFTVLGVSTEGHKPRAYVWAFLGFSYNKRKISSEVWGQNCSLHIQPSWVGSQGCPETSNPIIFCTSFVLISGILEICISWGTEVFRSWHGLVLSGECRNGEEIKDGNRAGLKSSGVPATWNEPAESVCKTFV